METLSVRALNRALLARQGLLVRVPADPLKMVEHLAGLQAQQARPPFVGLWTRLENFKKDDLMRPLGERRILRATTIRGTLHLVSRADFLAWRPVLQPMLSAGAQTILRDRLTTFDQQRVLGAARTAFSDRARTFTSLRDHLVSAFPEADERAMGYFVRMHLPLASVPDPSADWGFGSDAEFDLASAPGAEGDAASLVARYLGAFGPASVADFQAWSGLKSAKAWFEALNLTAFQDEKKRILYDLPNAPRPDAETPAPIRFIAEFDNLVLGHADRSRIVADEHRGRVVTKNLLVLGTFLVDGFVAGVWKVERKKSVAVLRLDPFVKLTVKARKALEQEGELLARFLEPEASGYETA